MMTLDQEAFGDEGSLYLFGSVLARFFSLYASINSFTNCMSLTAITKSAINGPYRWGSSLM